MSDAGARATALAAGEPALTDDERAYCEDFLAAALVAMLNNRRDEIAALQAQADQHEPEARAMLHAELWRRYRRLKLFEPVVAPGADDTLSYPPGELARLALDAMERRGRPPREPRERRKGERPAVSEPHEPQPGIGDFGARPDGSRNLWVVKMVAAPFEEGAGRHVYHAGLVCLPRTAENIEAALKLARSMIDRHGVDWHRGAAIWIEPALLSKETMPGAVSRVYTRESGLPAS